MVGLAWCGLCVSLLVHWWVVQTPLCVAGAVSGLRSTAECLCADKKSHGFPDPHAWVYEKNGIDHSACDKRFRSTVVYIKRVLNLFFFFFFFFFFFWLVLSFIPFFYRPA